MAKKQYFGLKFPFTTEGNENYLLDVNSTIKDKVRSILMHVIFTPKNQRIRRPDFGTNLIRYIFENNDESSWEYVKTDIQQIVTTYIPNMVIDNISILRSEDTLEEIYVRIDYSIMNGNEKITDSIYTKL